MHIYLCVCVCVSARLSNALALSDIVIFISDMNGQYTFKIN